MAPGIYREYVDPKNAGTEDARITYRSAEPLGAEIIGAEIIKDWKPFKGNVWVCRVDNKLFGDYNPEGKLPITFYKNVNQLPDFLDYTMQNRTYRYMHERPLFPFGHGLSYTTFSFSKPTYKNGKVNVKVTNTGKREGTETVQVYLQPTNDNSGIFKTLRGFAKVKLQPNETKTVEIDMPSERFETWDEVTHTMRVLPGKYLLMVGNSSDDSALKVIRVKR